MKKLVLFLFILMSQISLAQIVDIPDPNFKAALIEEGVDTNGDGEIQVSEAEAITELNVRNQNINSLIGINNFVNLTSLNCGWNDLMVLDISELTQLTELICNDNALTSLDESTLGNLSILNCHENQITALDVSGMTNLLDLDCSVNQLSSLDLSNLTQLNELICYRNQITALDVSNLIQLNKLHCPFNQITSLDVSNLNNLEFLSCSKNNLTSLIVSGAANLKTLACSANELSTLDLSNLPNVQEVICDNNELTSLDVSVNTNVRYLSCRFNEITSLDVSMLSYLEELHCHANELTSLNAAGLSNLKDLWCSSNNLTSLNLSGLTNIEYLKFDANQITTANLINIEGLTNLKILSCYSNSLTSLDVSTLVNLTSLYCTDNQLTEINVSNLDQLINFRVNHNQLTELDISDLISLEEIYCGNNQLTELDLSNQSNLDDLQSEDNLLTHLDISQTQNLRSLMLEDNLLETLSIKNGKTDTEVNYRLNGNPTLIHICVDSDEQEFIQGVVDSFGYTNCVVNPFCTLEPGGDVYYIQGEVKVDVDQDGCDPDDLGFPFMQFKVTNVNGDMGIFSSELNGSYSIPLPEDSYTIEYQFPYMSYFDISPTSFSVNFPTDASPFVQDICLTPNGSYNDLQVAMIPLDEARPGFDAHYKVIYANVGTNVLSGNVTLNFDDDVIDLVSSSTNPDSQNTGELSWSFTNLAPLEFKTIDLVMNLNTPTQTPPLNGGEILCYDLTITPTNNDEVPYDNTFSLKQTVVNSYDPNDKTCLEGDVITPDLVGEYVHYLIRFENTGTASAINVVIRDVIDMNKFDMDSFVPMEASHDFVTRIQNDNEVEFIFEGIDLPFDDANNDGYVLFKIKTLPMLEVGDTFENSAEIYFDFNFPIITNIEETTVDNLVSTDQFTLNSNLKIFPNPAENYIKIDSQLAFDSVLIHDLTGKEIKRIVSTESRSDQDIEVSNLKSGIYYLTIQSGNSKSTKKFLKI